MQIGLWQQCRKHKAQVDELDNGNPRQDKGFHALPNDTTVQRLEKQVENEYVAQEPGGTNVGEHQVPAAKPRLDQQ